MFQHRRSEIGDSEKKSSDNSKIDGKNKKTFTMLTNSIKDREVILQSALVLLENPPTQEQIEAKMILDTGSQRSYISQKVLHHLNLKAVRTEEISINSFGEKLTELKKARFSCVQHIHKINNRALDVKRF